MSEKALKDLTDYSRDLRRHTRGRTAFHFRLSELEKQFRESYYKLGIGAAVRPLLERFNGRGFSLSNGDMVVILLEVTDNDISPILAKITRIFKESGVFRGAEPMVGNSDRLWRWFDLEADYESFVDYVSKLPEAVASGTDPLFSRFADQQGETSPKGNASLKAVPQKASNSPGAAVKPRTPTTVDPASGLIRPGTPDDAPPPPPSRKVRYIQIRPDKRQGQVKDLDPEMLRSLSIALDTTDLEPFKHFQQVRAILPQADPEQVMTHLFIPIGSVLDVLLGETKLTPNQWFYRYLEDRLSERLLELCPKLPRAGDLAGSIRVSSQSILSERFEQFDQSQGETPRSRIVLEFSVHEVLQAYSIFLGARSRAVDGDYRVSIADIDIRLLPWLDLKRLDADFLKVVMPPGSISNWLTAELRSSLPLAIKKVGVGRIILADADVRGQLELGQEWGIRLFQGNAVSAASI